MIHLDANATATLRPEARRAMEQYLAESSKCSNPSSIHETGRNARAVIRNSRDSVLKLLQLDSKSAELIFTSGGTESCNLMLQGLLGDVRDLVQFPKHILSSSIEHPAVKEVLAQLESWGWRISWVDPGPEGIVLVSDFMSQVAPDTALVCLMAANNETGAIQPIQSLAQQLRTVGYAGLIVSDMVQAIGKCSVSAKQLIDSGVDALAISAHKLGSLSGTGAVVFAKSTTRCSRIFPRQLGGAQEGGIRSGTENLLGINTFGAVSKYLAEHLELELIETRRLRDLLWHKLSISISDIHRITPIDKNSEQSLANTLNLRFAGCRGDDLVVALDLAGIACSTGAACASGKQGVSYVLKSMGIAQDNLREHIRLSLDWSITESQIPDLVETISRIVNQVRQATNSDYKQLLFEQTGKIDGSLRF